MAKTNSALMTVRAPLYEVKVELVGTEPPVWRRLLVLGDMNLGLLHAVIQVAMGWTNSHLHDFTVGNARYTDPAMDEDMGPNVPAPRDEHTTAIMDIATRTKAEFTYEYDFGDSWGHVVTVEAIRSVDAPASFFAECLEGCRACPPEDCGGVGGYADLLEVIKDPQHEEYESMMEWLGGRFDPEAFDVNKVNACLRKLKWPHTTEEQLAAVLMARDGVK